MLAERSIMRAQLLHVYAFAFSSLAAVVAAQGTGGSTTTQPAKKDNPKSLTLTGCIAPDGTNAGHYTLADFVTGAPTYRLAGTDVRRYLGKRVELVGDDTQRKLKIVGGLTPSPNAAAQAGAMDPAEAARANLGAAGETRPGNIVVPELKVKSVKAVSGPCPPHQ
jgi:hypothetical protein